MGNGRRLCQMYGHSTWVLGKGPCPFPTQVDVYADGISWDHFYLIFQFQHSKEYLAEEWVKEYGPTCNHCLWGAFYKTEKGARMGFLSHIHKYDKEDDIYDNKKFRKVLVIKNDFRRKLWPKEIVDISESLYRHMRRNHINKPVTIENKTERKSYPLPAIRIKIIDSYCTVAVTVDLDKENADYEKYNSEFKAGKYADLCKNIIISDITFPGTNASYINGSQIYFCDRILRDIQREIGSDVVCDVSFSSISFEYD